MYLFIYLLNSSGCVNSIFLLTLPSLLALSHFYSYLYLTELSCSLLLFCQLPFAIFCAFCYNLWHLAVLCQDQQCFQRNLMYLQQRWPCLFINQLFFFSLLWRLSDMSQKQMTSSMAIAGAVMGAVLALFLITVFTIVLLTARKAPPTTYSDKV